MDERTKFFLKKYLRQNRAALLPMGPMTAPPPAICSSSCLELMLRSSSCWNGIAKLFVYGRIQPVSSPSCDHFSGIVGPEAESICPCMTIGVGGETIEARFEDVVDLVISCKETLRLSGRLEAAHDFLSSSRRPVAAFSSIVKTLVGPMISICHLARNQFDVAAQFVSDDTPWLAKLSN